MSSGRGSVAVLCTWKGDRMSGVAVVTDYNISSYGLSGMEMNTPSTVL